MCMGFPQVSIICISRLSPPPPAPCQEPLLFGAAVTVVLCTASNLAAPVLTGILFEALVGTRAIGQYKYYLSGMAVMYIAEPVRERDTQAVGLWICWCKLLCKILSGYVTTN
jgi:hypothetical protein